MLPEMRRPSIARLQLGVRTYGQRMEMSYVRLDFGERRILRRNQKEDGEGMNGKFTGELKVNPVNSAQILGHFLLGQDDYWSVVAEMDERIEGYEEIAEMMVKGERCPY